MMYVALGLFALILGSFFTMLIYRLPLMIAGQNISPITPKRSQCPHCGSDLSFSMLIPIFSYIWYKGSCKYCHTPISKLYPLVELLTVCITLGMYVALGLSYELAFWLVFSYALLIIFFTDATKYIVPDVVVYPVLWLGVLYHLWYGDVTASIYGVIVGYISLWIIYWGYTLLTTKEGMGHGDFKFFALIGAWLGWQSLSAVMAIASLCALVYYFARFRNPPTVLPLASYMSIAVVIMQLGREFKILSGLL